MNPLELLVLCMMSACAASSYHFIISTPGHTLGWFREWLDTCEHRIRSRWGYGRALTCWKTITRSFVACSYCLAGQIAVVVYLSTQYATERSLVAHVFTLIIFTATSIYIEPWTGSKLKEALKQRGR